MPTMFPRLIRMRPRQYHHNQRRRVRNCREQADRDCPDSRKTTNQSGKPEGDPIARKIHSEVHQDHKPNMNAGENLETAASDPYLRYFTLLRQRTNEPSTFFGGKPMRFLWGVGEIQEDADTEKDRWNAFQKKHPLPSRQTGLMKA